LYPLLLYVAISFKLVSRKNKIFIETRTKKTRLNSNISTKLRPLPRYRQTPDNSSRERPKKIR